MYEYMEDLLASGEKDSNASDYLNDMKDLCQLFRDMKEYEYWKQTISAVETYTIDQKTVFFQLFLTELWMDYYQTVGNEERYVELCVAHADLYKLPESDRCEGPRLSDRHQGPAAGKRGGAQARGDYVCDGCADRAGEPLFS